MKLIPLMPQASCTKQGLENQPAPDHVVVEIGSVQTQPGGLDVWDWERFVSSWDSLGGSLLPPSVLAEAIPVTHLHLPERKW